MKKKLVSLIAIALFLISGVIVIDTVFSGKETKNDGECQIVHRKEQDRVAQFIVKEMELTDNEEIKKINFTQFEKDDLVGNWLITVKVNDKYLISLNEEKLGEMIRTSGYSPEEFKKRKPANTIHKNKKIEINYFEKGE
ncbi:DUF2768 domain-containing protein [Streptococcus iniae]|uniref:DUF2768 domain-containing protein n=1 Tax=Streptococcus iniae TaxID=1346 RepID=UPI0008D95172|nr:DUF2768 domain-containing protein [Streptococcus iniae]OHX27854.1 hypothetical protein BKX95_03435 [Streptococcus iniae]RLV28202.1 DUF2768 domain-containing protein [Streptococcus iniae]